MALPYYYNKQIKQRITDFMAIFAGLQVETGKQADGDTKLINVPIRYGDVDRVVAHIKGEGTQNKSLKIPIMSAVYSSIDLDEGLRKGTSVERVQTYMPTGGSFPNDIKTVHQMMPIPYRLFMELAIYTSNTDQQLQILEQLLVLFDPTLQIQSNDSLFDWTKITSVKLEGVGLENTYPAGTDRPVRVVKLQFSMPIYLNIPANVKDEFVKSVLVRIGVVSTGAVTTEDMMVELDEQGLDYTKWFDLDDINL